MEYRTGTVGRIVVVRFRDGDDVLAGLREIMDRENIAAAAFHLVGGLRGGHFVVGPEREEMPPVPMWRSLAESHEAFGFGTIFREDGEPKVHFHGVYGKRDEVRMGCMRKGSETFLVMEAFVQELIGIDARRMVDPVSGMSLLELGRQ